MCCTILTILICVPPPPPRRPAGVSYRGGTPMGIEAARGALPARAPQLARLLQHQILHAQNVRGPSTALIYTHHEGWSPVVMTNIC